MIQERYLYQYLRLVFTRHVCVFKRTVKFINNWEIAIVSCQLNSNLQMWPSDHCCYTEGWLYPLVKPTSECSLNTPAQTPFNELGLSPVSWNRCVQVSSISLRLVVAFLVCLCEHLLTPYQIHYRTVKYLENPEHPSSFDSNVQVTTYT